MLALGLVALALSVLALALPAARAAVWTLDLALVVAFALDFLRTPSPSKLDVRRSLPQRAGLSRSFVRTVRLAAGPASARAIGLRVALFERFPVDVEVVGRTDDGSEGVAGELVAPVADDPSGGPDRGVLGERGLILRRSYSSGRRGVQTFGDMRVRLSGALGLVQRQSRFFGEQSVAIEPALPGLKRTLLLAASERWRDLGVRRLRLRGGSLEFESMRDYVRGDDVRAIDWKAWAKRARPMVREYEQERGQELLLLIDQGRLMSATTAEGEAHGWSKFDHALDAALQLAAIALERGDRVGIATFDVRLRAFVPPARGAAQFARLKEAVFAAQPTLLESSLRRALRELGVRHRRRATIIAISDVADPYSVERQRAALTAASRRHRVVLACLDDPDVRAAGQAHGAPAVRAAALRSRQERATGLAELARSGASIIDSLPAESAGPLLAAWLEMRRRG